MKLGLRARLFLVSSLSILVAVLLGGTYLETMQRARMERSIEDKLAHLASTARVTAERASLDEQSGAGWQGLALQLADATHARVTMIDAVGRVLGDSQVPGELVGDMENHGQRPEVVGARLVGRGMARRASATLSTDMLYVAGRGGAMRSAYRCSDGAAGAGLFVLHDRAVCPLRDKDRAGSVLRSARAGASRVGTSAALVDRG
ncbi:MAG: hypothetical protein MUF54_05080 [Polyangiaceae bacterium]|nr:hypothetical protein [Polyangiaceae bacterium]